MSIRLVWVGYWPRGRFFWEHRNSAWRVFWCGPIGLVLGESLSIKKALVSTAKALVVAAILTTLGAMLIWLS